MRRPAAPDAPGKETVDQRWEKGETVDLSKLGYAKLVDCGPVVVEEGHYYHQKVKAAGRVLGVVFDSGRCYLRLALTGTLSENLLKFCTGRPGGEVRGHVCPEDCNLEEAADDLVHLKKIRKMREEKAEDAWVDNLRRVSPMGQEVDELNQLRKQMPPAPAGVGTAAPDKKEKERGQSREDRERSKKKKKAKKDKKKRKKSRSPSRGGKESSEGLAKTDGSQPKGACQKKGSDLFRGTGLDPRDRVRNRVARGARRHVKKKSDRSSSSNSGSSSTSSKDFGQDGQEESLFDQGSKVRLLAERFPGALSNQALQQMRTSLLQEIGHEDRPNVLHPVATAYCQQHLLKKASGPVQRELLTLCHGLDLLLKAKPASAADVLMQRVKSIEQTLLGSHWSVSQKMEVLPPDNASITALPEAKAAQKEVYEETRLRWLSSNESRAGQKGGKGGGKDRSAGKEGPGRSQDRDSKGGKKGAGKGDSSKKKES